MTSRENTNTNQRGEFLLEYLLTYNFIILNERNKAAFFSTDKTEANDISTDKYCLISKIESWHVPEKVSC